MAATGYNADDVDVAVTDAMGDAWVGLADGGSPDVATLPAAWPAYDAATDRLFVTGKLWPKVFEIQFVKK